jgi:hypothetical protein
MFVDCPEFSFEAFVNKSASPLYTGGFPVSLCDAIKSQAHCICRLIDFARCVVHPGFNVCVLQVVENSRMSTAAVVGAASLTTILDLLRASSPSTDNIKLQHHYMTSGPYLVV